MNYLGLFPNLLISLHPDYVMTHRLEPLAPGLTAIECQWYFPARGDGSRRTPSTSGMSPTAQDWAACESRPARRGSPHFRPGPLAPAEDAVYQWVTMIAPGTWESHRAQLTRKGHNLYSGRLRRTFCPHPVITHLTEMDEMGVGMDR